MTVAWLDTVHDVLRERLEGAGMTCVDATGVSRAELLAGAGHDWEGIVVRSRISLDCEALEALPGLRFIARSGSGLENIDVAAAANRGIQVFNSPEGNRDAVAEHAMGFVLALLTRMRSADRSVRDGRWEREAHRGRELGSRTVAVFGFGHTGEAFARRLRCFGCQILAVDPYRPDAAEAANAAGAQLVDAATALQVADIISLHLPLTSETHGLVDAAWLSNVQPGTLLINTSRGPIVSTAALLDALDTGRLAGAALDVLEFEETSLEAIRGGSTTFERLLRHPEVLLSPHVAGWTVESYVRLSSVLADKILDAFPR
ncbi:MAG: NAD(P)-dependent oxidoreductase [Flavobacteriales bacterium]